MEKVVKLVKKYKVIFLIVTILMIGIIIVLQKAFAALTPIKSVEIKSESLDYDSNTPGSWKVTKSAKWTGKGEAEIAFEIDSKMKIESKSLDVLFVIDLSSSMVGDKLDRAKRDSKELIEYILSNRNNRVGIIEFGTKSTIVSNFSNNKDDLISKIDSLIYSGETNYYQALLNVDKVLKNYKKEDGKECVVLFLTDGAPNKDTPNEVGQYKYLKQQYPYITINGIQYEMGDTIAEPIVKISDNQYIAHIETLYNILFVASETTLWYDNFEIEDYINTNNFYVAKSEDIIADVGKVIFDKVNQKITWKIDKLRSGQPAKLKIVVKLNNELINKGGIYATNNREIIKSKIDDKADNIESTKTPILADIYKVIYDGNDPSDCTVTNLPITKNAFIGDVVEISEIVPKCTGYQFKGWKLKNDKVEKLNDDYFIMPEEDVIIRAEWSKIKLDKTMDGTIEEGLTLYKQVEQDVSDPTKYAAKYTGDTSTFKGDKNVYYYYGEAANNYVSFAGYIWRIVRTTDTGGVKLILDKKLTNGECGITNQGTVKLSSTVAATPLGTPSYAAVTGAGYMYNTMYLSYGNASQSSKINTSAKFGNTFVYSDGSYSLKNTVDITDASLDDISNYHYTCLNTTGTCEKINYVLYGFKYSTSGINVSYITLSDGKNVNDALNEMLYNEDVNKYDGSPKKYIDYWYKNKLTQYTDYLEDTVWCNDRGIADYGAFNPNGGKIGDPVYFRSYLDSKNLTCLNRNDSFTVNEENGNGALTYPIGLVTKQEYDLSLENDNSPLFDVQKNATYPYYPQNFWTMSPYYFPTGGASFVQYYTNDKYSNNYQAYLKPSISLKAGTEFTYGDGSESNPYVIAMN